MGYRILIGFFKTFFKALFGTRAIAVYILSFAIAIAVATFIENDFGASSSQKIIYTAWWFTLLLFLFGISIVVNIFRFQMVPLKKWAPLVFHAAMIVILLGAAVTRYFGYDGIMHIRENEATSKFLSSNPYLRFKATRNGQVYEFDEPVLFASLGSNQWNELYKLESDLVNVQVVDFIPNPVEVLDSSALGIPTLKLVMAGGHGREEYLVHYGETLHTGSLDFCFQTESSPDAIQLSLQNDLLFIAAERPLIQSVMATQKIDTLFPGGAQHPLQLGALYQSEEHSFVFSDFKRLGKVRIESKSPKVTGESMAAIKLLVSVNGDNDTLLVTGAKGLSGKPAVARLDGMELAVSYGSRAVELPFSLRLKDFIIERYPGTNSAASYVSDVQLVDDRDGRVENYRIYMNHILDYDGFRFFQSSFDNDEQGTYLSVNHDFWGTWISYFGYALLTAGFVMSLLSKKSRFYQISQSIRKLRMQSSIGLIVMGIVSLPSWVSSQSIIEVTNSHMTIDEGHSIAFSQLIVQDPNGRMKPMHTLNREVMRKLLKKETYKNLTADQTVLGMFANSADWIDVPMIYIGKHKSIQKLLHVSNSLARYRDFFNGKGEYRLFEEVNRAYGLQPADRGVYEKELMKIDERVNIANMVYSGRIFKLIPVPGDPNNTWASAQSSGHDHAVESPVATKFFDSYRSALQEAMHNGDYRLPGQLVAELSSYQQTKGALVVPDSSRISAEIYLNKLNLFNRLAVVYGFLGIAFLAFLFMSVFKPGRKLTNAYNLLVGLAMIAFIVHAIGLGLRWYVSERAPWSNGYESMIYIAWTTILAGVLFTRKSFGGLAATMILATTVLLVAMLSDMDPEITPLVPVLKSYWLTIHVSLEAGSYGFLMLGAIMGLINLILLSLLNRQNREKIERQVREMSYLTEMILIGGLVMISIGTFLGGIWANESWGRYWGWDAKETWALVTILVYSFILHMRIVPQLQGLFLFNALAFIGVSSVLMTYYGVNYYLSGLHSYAAGDPVPVPPWVFWSSGVAVTVIFLAYRKKRIYNISM
jgi:cytochrome c-type biogenesis protein CcsB